MTSAAVISSMLIAVPAGLLCLALTMYVFVKIENMRVRQKALESRGDTEIRRALKAGVLSEADLMEIGLDPDDYKGQPPALPEARGTNVSVSGNVRGSLEIRASGGSISIRIGGSCPPMQPMRPMRPMKPMRPVMPNLADMEEYENEVMEWRDECREIEDEYRQEMDEWRREVEQWEREQESRS